MGLDRARTTSSGYVYVATETPSSRGGDFWGGQRPGNNLFAESLVCLDARTGKRVWHFQAVHHGIWDYDFNAQPNLVDITVDGRRIKAIAEVSKQAFVYVLDRVTGQPVWPIEERPVPPGNMPGEWYAPTQPFPTKPPAYDQQGVDDRRPDRLHSRAAAGGDQDPQSVSLRRPVHAAVGRRRAAETKGTVQMPGAAGGANWTGAGADPETGMLYVTSVHAPFIAEMIKAKDPEARRVNHPTRRGGGRSSNGRRGAAPRVTGPWLEGPRGLPIFKPPYGRLVAIDLNTRRDPVDRGQRQRSARSSGDQAPEPAAARTRRAASSPLVTKTMVFLGEGGNNAVVALPPCGGGKMFRAYDKATGQVALGDGAARRHHRRADDLHVRRQAVHRRRHWMEGHGERARRAGAAVIVRRCLSGTGSLQISHRSEDGCHEPQQSLLLSSR